MFAKSASAVIEEVFKNDVKIKFKEHQRVNLFGKTLTIDQNKPKFDVWRYKLTRLQRIEIKGA